MKFFDTLDKYALVEVSDQKIIEVNTIEYDLKYYQIDILIVNCTDVQPKLLN